MGARIAAQQKQLMQQQLHKLLLHKLFLLSDHHQYILYHHQQHDLISLRRSISFIFTAGPDLCLRHDCTADFGNDRQHACPAHGILIPKAHGHRDQPKTLDARARAHSFFANVHAFSLTLLPSSHSFQYKHALACTPSRQPAFLLSLLHGSSPPILTSMPSCNSMTT